MEKKFLVNVVSAFFLGAILNLLFYRFSGKNVKQTTVKIGNESYILEIADTQRKRARGLMLREKLNPNQGMLFVFPQEARHSFWMYKTKIPLDIIWLDKDWKVVHIEKNVPPCESNNPAMCESYRPRQKAKYVIEILPQKTY